MIVFLCGLIHARFNLGEGIFVDGGEIHFRVFERFGSLKDMTSRSSTIIVVNGGLPVNAHHPHELLAEWVVENGHGFILFGQLQLP